MSTQVPSVRKLKVFISYSRQDKAFAEELLAALVTLGHQAYLDTRDIKPGEPWEDRLERLILDADTVVFVVSPASVASTHCLWEIERTIALGKRLLPVVLRRASDNVMPLALGRLNFIFFDEPNSFGHKLGELAEALTTDLEWIREHTRLGGRAEEWMAGGRKPTRLLSGSDIAAAKAWVGRRPANVPDPPELLLEFIRQSEGAELARTNAERQQLEVIATTQAAREQALLEAEAAQRKRSLAQRRANWLLGAVALVVLVATLLQAWAFRLIQIREVESMVDFANLAILEQRHESAMRAALFRLPSRGSAPWELGWEEPSVSALETRLAAAAQLSPLRLILTGHSGPVRSVSFSPDGRRILTSSEDGTARIWDAENGEELLELTEDGQPPVSHASFSPDGTRVVTAHNDGFAYLWDANSGQRTLTLSGHAKRMRKTVFSPDGTRLATASHDGTARIWDANSGAELVKFEGHGGASVSGVAFRSDGLRVVSTGTDQNGRIRVWDAATGEALWDAGFWNADAEFSTDGSLIVSARVDGMVQLWDAETGDVRDVLQGHRHMAESVALSSDGSRIVSTSQDKTARIWSVADRREIEILAGHTDTVIDAAFSPDGRRVVTASFDHTARVWDIGGREARTLVEESEGILRSVAFSPDGNRILAASEDHQAYLWDTRSGEEVLRLKGHSEAVLAAAFSPDGSRIVTAGMDDTARLWDANIGLELRVLAGHGNDVQDASFHPEGGRIVTASSDGTARVWQVENGDELLKIDVGTGKVMCAAFSPDGDRIAIGLDTGSAEVRDAYDESVRLVTDAGHTAPIRDVEFSPDGKRIATASEDGSARLWDARTGKLMHHLVGHGGSVQTATFSPAGDCALTTAFDGKIGIWDTTSGVPVWMLAGHLGPVAAADCSSDGRWIVSVGTDGTVRVWEADWLLTLRREELIRRVCTERLIGNASRFTQEDAKVLSLGRFQDFSASARHGYP